MTSRLRLVLRRLLLAVAGWLLLVAGFAVWLRLATRDEPGRADLPLTHPDSIGLPLVGFAALAAVLVLAVTLLVAIRDAVRARRARRGA